MEEKVLIKSDRYSIGKILCIIAISVAIVCVLIGVVRYKIFIADYELCDVTVFVESPYVESHYKVYPQKCNESEWYDKCYEHQYTENYDALKSATEYAEWHVKWTARIGCIAVVGVSLLCTFIYFWLRSYEMVVTDKRVYGVINIPKNFSTGELSNGYYVRRAAIDYNIPLITNARLATAFIRAFCAMSIDDIQIKSWDQY